MESRSLLLRSYFRAHVPEDQCTRCVQNTPSVSYVVTWLFTVAVGFSLLGDNPKKEIFILAMLDHSTYMQGQPARADRQPEPSPSQGGMQKVLNYFGISKLLRQGGHAGQLPHSLTSDSGHSWNWADLSTNRELSGWSVGIRVQLIDVHRRVPNLKFNP